VTHINSVQLKESSWTVVHDICSQRELLIVASDLGTPIDTGKGFVPYIVPKSKKRARSGTFGSVYGTAGYPPHTDTAHWPTPAKYIVLSAQGDIRRPTTLLKIRSFFDSANAKIKEHIDKAIWYTGNQSSRFYCTTTFKVDGEIGWRFDPMCMKPANESARIILPLILEQLEHSELYNHPWSKRSALVIDNWRMLHGRGPEPINEGARQLFRVLVR